MLDRQNSCTVRKLQCLLKPPILDKVHKHFFEEYLVILNFQIQHTHQHYVSVFGRAVADSFLMILLQAD
ncbi:hypothetical protein D9M71_800300 [compost metagenome]